MLEVQFGELLMVMIPNCINRGDMSIILDFNKNKNQAVPIQQEPLKNSSVLGDCFPKLEENVIWLWTVSTGKLQDFGQEMRVLMNQVVAAIRSYFGFKAESFDKSVNQKCDSVSETKQNFRIGFSTNEKGSLQNLEEPKPQFFVPAPVFLEAPREGKVLEIQTPANLDQANQEGGISNFQEERVGIFTLILNYFSFLR
jgi:hypothetical protein